LPTLSEPLVSAANPPAAAIELEGVGKCYRIYGNPQERFRQALIDQFGGWWRPGRDTALYREYWALRDVSFRLSAGEALGVIGRNGAGKSTLLQIIAGTLDPSQGRVQTRGRTTALLELGSGFNSEFTGRENVYLNAQILGLSREEAAARFDEIASFADIGDFIEQPVKIYSSGMVMRLAFAVQTVLEPDILIVDEALAVGDARFQAKCFRKIRALRDRGVAILLVSHDINAIISFCDRAILLDRGRLVESGDPRYVAKRYMHVSYSEQGTEPGVAADASGPDAVPAVAPDDGAAMSAGSGDDATNDSQPAPLPDDESALAAGEPPQIARIRDAAGHPAPYAFGTKQVEIQDVWMTDDRGRRAEVLVSGQTYRIVQRVIAHTEVHDLSSGIVIRNRHGIELYGVTTKSSGILIPDLQSGQRFEFTITIDMWLAAGDYFLQVAHAGPDGVQYDCRVDAYHFTVIDTPHLFTSSVVNLNQRLSIQLL